MDEAKAKEVLSERVIQADGGLTDLDWYIEYLPEDDYATLDGCFEVEELEAIAWWMKNKGKK